MNLPHLPKYLALAAVTGLAVVGAQTAITPASAKTVTAAVPAAITAPQVAAAAAPALAAPGAAAQHPVTLPRGGASAEARAAIAHYAQARIAASFYPPFETGDTSSYDCTLASNWLDVPLNPGQGPGRAGAGPSVAGIHAAFPDLRITIEAIYVAGDTVTVRTTYRGTQAGPILGVPATGRKIEFRATDIHQVRHGQIVRTDHLEDLFGLYSQITAK